MSKYIFLFFLAIPLLSCKKTIEKIKENKIIDIMVDGQWKITQFTIDAENRITEFANYTFKYHRNKTVDAIENGIIRFTGAWDGDISLKTTWANFGNIIEPISSLNGTWNITNNTSSYVVLNQTSGGSTKHMRLEKI